MTPEQPVVLELVEGLEKLCSRDLARNLVGATRTAQQLADQVAAAEAEQGVDGVDPKLRQEMGRAKVRLVEDTAALRSDLADRIGHGEFHLQGRVIGPDVTDMVVAIPQEALEGAAIDLLSDSVSSTACAYDKVRLVFGPAPRGDEGRERRLSPLRALARWCDPWIVMEIRRIERFLPADSVRDDGHPSLAVPGSRRVATCRMSGNDRLHLRQRLDSSWKDLLKDLRGRILRREVLLLGVQTRPALATDPEVVPHTWADDLVFNLEGGSVTAHGHRWTAVECSLDPPVVSETTVEDTASGEITPARPVIIRPEDVAKFDDDTILALLEEHHRRVVEGPDARLISPAKVSFMPLLKRRMEYRAGRGELLPNLASESAALAAWIEAKASSHQLPTVGAISNALRQDYAVLRTQFSPTMP